MSQIDLIPFLQQDNQPSRSIFRTEVFASLSRPRKALPCKYFYDERGSRLFDRICELEEYYPTRTELDITRERAQEIAEAIGPCCRLVEFGSGSSIKTRVLLDHLLEPAGYVPIDISGEHLLRSAAGLADCYPGLPINPVCADYTTDFQLPLGEAESQRVVAYFPGSTIGNFEPHEAIEFLNRVRKLCGAGSGLLIGVDLKKDPRILHAAYNDAAGVTAEFNLNLLARINRDLRGDFILDGFAHYASYSPGAGRVEMHLVSLENQAARISGRRFQFDCGESIHTENCYKYTLEGFRKLAEKARYQVDRIWLDEMRLFSVQFLIAST
jgi:dimethylhistidine N-methyltransferase